MKFDLEQFKNGMKARTRDGSIATFVGICEECRENARLVAHIEGDTLARSFGMGGEYVTDDVSEFDLVSMVNPWEDVPIDAKVRVRMSETDDWLKRHFAGVNSEGKPIVWTSGLTSWTKKDMIVYVFTELVED